MSDSIGRGRPTTVQGAWHAEFNEPRLVTVYDAETDMWSRPKDDFFLSMVSAMVSDRSVARILDLGCGTGRFALRMAGAGHTVTGVDPARASLDAARAKPMAERVSWFEGTSSVIPDTAFDVAVMTNHVAQFLIFDHEWRSTLVDLRRALVPGGRLMFDVRNPDARSWKRWNRKESMRGVDLPSGDRVWAWVDVDSVVGGVVSYTNYYAFADGPILASTASVCFRDTAILCSSLEDAGFVVEEIHHGYGEAMGIEDDEVFVIART